MLRLHVYGRDTPVVNEEAFLRHAAYNLSFPQAPWTRRSEILRFKRIETFPTNHPSSRAFRHLRSKANLRSAPRSHSC